MVIFDAALVLAVVGVVVYGALHLLMRASDRRRLMPAHGQWRNAHYDVDGTTHIVVQKISIDGHQVLDEHVVSTVRIDDHDYDAKFLTAMAKARERRALFEAEEEG
jgi:hypothetical protein